MPFVSNGSDWGFNSPAWASASAVWSAIMTGDAPEVTMHEDAGDGATVVDVEGNRWNFRLSVKTGASPVLALTGYSEVPYAFAAPRDALTAAAFIVADAESTDTVVIKAHGEIEPGSTYSLNVTVQGR